MGLSIASAAARADDEPGTLRALIVVGLPGDGEHEEQFTETAAAWRNWLTGPLAADPPNVRVLWGGETRPEFADGQSTRETLQAEIGALRESLKPQDRLWVMFLGHGGHDGRRGQFHLPGPDLDDVELGKLFGDLACREQVFWLTHSASGWFVKSLAREGRIVIAATEPADEFNETEFPHALSTVSRLARANLDADGDGAVSVLEVFDRTVSEVEARFAADQRIPSEHARLDDNGDGIGSEKPAATADSASGDSDLPPAAPSATTPDGVLAAETHLPLQP